MMNGKKIPIYELECNKKVYYPYEIEETKNEKSLLRLNLKNLNLKKVITFGIDYNYDKSYYFNLIVDEIIESDDNIDFKVISGNGYGILDDCGGNFGLFKIFNGKDDSWGKHDINDFNLEECNRTVKNGHNI